MTELTVKEIKKLKNDSIALIKYTAITIGSSTAFTYEGRARILSNTNESIRIDFLDEIEGRGSMKITFGYKKIHKENIVFYKKKSKYEMINA